MKPPTGVVVALPAEARCLVARRRAGASCESHGLLLQVSGVGAASARHAGETLLAAGARSLLSFGVAAGLVPGLAAGTLLLPSEVITVDGRRLATDRVWREHWALLSRSMSSRDGVLAEAPAVLADSDAKRGLAAQTGAIAADMESAAVLSLAAGAGVPALVVRCVLDPLEQALPVTARVALRPDGSTHIAAVVLSLLRRPRELPSLIALAAGNRRALTALRCFADLVLGAPRPAAADDAARHARQNSRRPIHKHHDDRP